MKLMLIGDDGQVIDSTDDFSRDDWDALSPAGAKALLDELNAGAR